MGDVQGRKRAFAMGYLAGLSGMPLAIAPTLDVSGMYSYNGAILPGYHRVDTVDKFWHQTIMKHESEDMYIFYDTLMGGFSISPSGGVTASGVEAVLTCRSGNRSWWLEKASDYVGEDGYIGRVENFVWTDVDIRNTAGTQIVKYGTQPVPAVAYPVDNRMLVLGCRIGYRIRPQIGAGGSDSPLAALRSYDGYALQDSVGRYLTVGKPDVPDAPVEPDVPDAPIAYLYNGIQLPALPAWDRSAYPFAYIAYKESIGYMFGVSGTARHANNQKTVMVLGNDYTRKLVDGEWVAAGGGLGFTPVWANYDICYANDADTVLVPKSDPIPVYEN